MKKNALKALTLAVSLMLVFALVACSGGGETPAPSESASAEAPVESSEAPAESSEAPAESSEAPAASQDITVAMILQTLSNPFYVDMEAGANAMVEELAAEGINVTLEISAPQKETDREAVVNFFANAITKKVDAICIVPGDTQSIIPQLKEANAAGIPVVTIDSKLDPEIMEKEGVTQVAWVGSDNFEGGQIAGRAMGELFAGEEGPVEIAVIEGIAGHTTAEGRKSGFEAGLAEYDNCEIVASQPADWDQELGYNVMQNILTANPNIKGVFGCSDLMAVGAIQAIDAAGKTGEIQVIGFDYHESAQIAIKEGTMYGSVAQYPAEMGGTALRIAAYAVTDPSFTTEPEVYTKVELLTEA
jgi:ribose transport system substrate-binding protein